MHLTFVFYLPEDLQVHHTVVSFCNYEGVWYVKTQLSLYPIYYADDMFRPLWVILRSQNLL